MDRFVIYSKEHGYYRPAHNKSLYFSEEDFVEEVEDAKWWKQKKLAFELATKMHRDWNTNCVPIYIEIDELTPISSEEEIAAKLLECKALVKAADALSDADCEALPEKQWQEYLSAKRYIEAYDNE